MRLLLDAHISPAVAEALRQDGVDAVATRDWQDGAYRDAPDELILTAARFEGRTLVTYDCRTIPTLLRVWAETGQDHAGVILVDDRTVSQADVGGLTRAVRALLERSTDEEWTNRVLFLRAA